MDLCPAPKPQPQGYDMIWCASQCGTTALNGQSTPSTSSSSSSSSSSSKTNSPECDVSYLSVLTIEMKRAYAEDDKNPQSPPSSKIPHRANLTLPTAPEFINKCKVDKSSTHCQVFLGGACNPTTWRQDTAIPILKDMGISFFNPQVTDWEPGLMELEHQARENADVLFYVIDNQTRGVVVMMEVAYFVAKKRNVVLVVNGLKEPGQNICNEPISEIEYEHLIQSQVLLQELVEHHGIPVFNDIPTALNSVAKIVKEKIRVQDIQLADLQQKGIIHVGNKLINLRKTFDSLDSRKSGEIPLSQVRLAYRLLTNGDLTKDAVQTLLPKQDANNPEKSQNGVNNSSSSVNGTSVQYEDFCSLMSQLNTSSSQQKHSNKGVENILTKLLDHVPDTHKIKHERITASSSYDVYLGGDDDKEGESWRDTQAIPLLREQGLTHYSPGETNSRNVSIDKEAIDRCRVILFNVPSSTRSIEKMTMAAYCFGLGCQVVVCLGYLQDECQIKEEKLSKIAIKDYNRGRTYLKDMASREGIPIFEDIKEAVRCVGEKCKRLINNDKDKSQS